MRVVRFVLRCAAAAVLGAFVGTWITGGYFFAKGPPTGGTLLFPLLVLASGGVTSAIAAVGPAMIYSIWMEIWCARAPHRRTADMVDYSVIYGVVVALLVVFILGAPTFRSVITAGITGALAGGFMGGLEYALESSRRARAHGG